MLSTPNYSNAFKEQSAMIFITNKYTKYYYRIIDRAKSRINKPKTYLENHHIIPESFFINRSRRGPIGWVEGNPEDKSNKVKLTAHEHFVCHLLLVKMTDGRGHIKMANALNRLATKNNKNKKVKITGRMYAIIKKQLSDANSGNGNAMYGKPAWNKGLTKETNEIIKQTAEKNTGKSSWNKGLPHSNETKAKMSATRTGRKLTDEHKRKLSEGKKGPKNPNYGKPAHNKKVKV